MPTTPQSAAGWRIDPPVSEPRASGDEPGGHRGGRSARRAAGHPAGVARVAGRARTRSSRSTSPWRTRPCWSCPRRPPRPPAAVRPPWRRRAGASPPGSATRRWSARPGCTGCPSGPPARRPAAPGRRPAATAASTASAAARASSAMHLDEGVDVAVAGRDAARASSTTDRADRSPERTAAASVAADGPAAAHGASPTMRGTRNRPSSTVGRGGQHLVAVEAGPGLVGTEHVAHRQRVGRRRHPGQIEGGHVGGVVEHRGQLPGEAVELLVGQRRGGPGGPRGPRRRGRAGRRLDGPLTARPRRSRRSRSDTVRSSISSRS